MSNEMQPYSEGFSSQVVEQLDALLDASHIRFRPGGGGRQLKYIKGDTAIDAANRIFGYGKWGYKIVARSHEVIRDEKKGTVIEYYSADIELYVVGASYTFPGDGIGVVNSPTIEMHEKARKEATTDALKRALRHYGDQFGLSLYDEDDYVDAGDGTQVKVSQVKPNQQRQATPNRVIESKPAANALPPASKTVESKPAPAPHPTSGVSAPLPKDLRKRCDSLFGPGKWDMVLSRVLKAVVPDDNLTPEDCNALKNAFDNAERNRQQPKAS